ncbi:unnamed protein product [Caenorhabditis brenneri]
MSSAAASLESLQYLLQFEITNRCPALRAIERSVPLKIESLVFEENRVIVNATTYRFGIIRRYNVGETPHYVAASNERGGVGHEVDRYGIRDELDAHTVTPGDVDTRVGGEPEAKKQLTTVLFGGRNSPIYVTSFKFNCSQCVIRLPVGLKFHVEKLKLGGDVGRTLEALAPIFHESSFPLKQLDISLLLGNDVTHPIVQAARNLRIVMASLDFRQNILAITNPVVHINVMLLNEQTLERFIGNWIELNCPIGTEHTICLLQREPLFAFEMEDILKRLNGVPIDDDNVLIPMTAGTQLKVSYGPFPEFALRSKWAVRFSTVVTEH